MEDESIRIRQEIEDAQAHLLSGTVQRDKFDFCAMKVCEIRADTQALDALFDQIRSAVSVAIFDQVKSRILASPQSIIDEGTSTLQVQAANLQVRNITIGNTHSFLRP
jgi:outer membrane murein-binding lipoprotein Lpp